MTDHNSAPQPMTDADIIPAAQGNAVPIPPVKQAHADPIQSDDAGSTGADGTGRIAEARQALSSGTEKVKAQAADTVRTFADIGKERAGSALDQLSQLLTDAADQVDEKVGAQYGEYARSAAGQVSGLAESIRGKDVEELLEDARGFVRQSPAAAIGVAAALGFRFRRAP